MIISPRYLRELTVLRDLLPPSMTGIHVHRIMALDIVTPD